MAFAGLPSPAMNVTTASRSSRVLAVVLNWNRWRDTVRCVESLKAQTYPELDVIIIDNNSVDDSVIQLQKRFPECRFVANPQNYGFGKGCNFGIRVGLEIGVDFIWLLNNDAVAEPRALEELVARSIADPEVGQIGSVVNDFHDRAICLAWGGGSVNAFLGRAKHFPSQVKDSRLQFLTGASVLIPSRVLSTVGLFDEAFFLYWEDVDLSFRIRKAGFKLAVAPGSLIYHSESSSLGRSNPKLDFILSQSAKRFFLKHSRLPIVPISSNLITRCLNRLRRMEFIRLRSTLLGFFS